MALYSHVICDTQTGTVLTPAFPSDSPWERLLNGVGSDLTSTFELGDEINAALREESFITPWSRTLVTKNPDGSVRDARIIIDYDDDRDNQRLVVTHAPFRSIFSQRYPFGVSSYWANEAAHLPGSMVASNLEYRSIISRVLTLGITGPYPSYSLPLVLPPIVVGSRSLTVDNSSFKDVDSIITDIQTSSGGPDIDFEPRWSPSTGKLEYLIRVGTDAAPALTDAMYEFHMNVAAPALTKVHKKVDGSKQVTGVFTVGAGGGADMLVGGVGLGYSSPIPALDGYQSGKGDVNQDVLASQSASNLAVNQYVTKQWSFQLVADADPLMDLSAIRLGSILRLHFSGDYREPDGYQDLRVIGLKGDMSNIIVPTLQALVVA